jgi:hypothetical protein
LRFLVQGDLAPAKDGLPEAAALEEIQVLFPQEAIGKPWTSWRPIAS